MKILFIGDIFGKAGIRAIKSELHHIREKNKIDFVIANAENTTSCRGLSVSDYNNLMQSGIDLITMGNHTWFQHDVQDLLVQPNILRPLNIASPDELVNVGIGTIELTINHKKVRITNLIGKSTPCRWIKCSNPFSELETLVSDASQDIHIVDFHAESTSEKNCLLRQFKGRVSAIIGTHTHVPTNDARVIEQTAYISDAGMTGPTEGVIGAEAKSIIEMFFEKRQFFKLIEAKGKYQFCAVILEFDEHTNLPIEIKPIVIYEK